MFGYDCLRRRVADIEGYLTNQSDTHRELTSRVAELEKRLNATSVVKPEPPDQVHVKEGKYTFIKAGDTVWLREEISPLSSILHEYQPANPLNRPGLKKGDKVWVRDNPGSPWKERRFSGWDRRSNNIECFYNSEEVRTTGWNFYRLTDPAAEEEPDLWEEWRKAGYPG